MNDDNIIDLEAHRADAALAKEEWASIDGEWVRLDVDSKRLVQVVDVDALEIGDSDLSGHIVVFRCDADAPVIAMSAIDAETVGMRLLRAAAFAKIKDSNSQGEW